MVSIPGIDYELPWQQVVVIILGASAFIVMLMWPTISRLLGLCPHCGRKMNKRLRAIPCGTCGKDGCTNCMELAGDAGQMWGILKHGYRHPKR